MAPSTRGFETIILSGVRPIISLAKFPTDKILLSKMEIATTDGSLIIIPFLGIKTTVLVVPKSIPIFFISDLFALRQLLLGGTGLSGLTNIFVISSGPHSP